MFFVIVFLWNWNETELFQSYGHCWIFQICWHIECSTFTASSFRIWNCSTGIPSLPLALFLVMLPKAHLTFIPGCLAVGEWSHHHDYLGHEDLFCIVLLCILAISSASVKFIWILSFIVFIFAWNVPLVSLIFLKRSLVFPSLLFSSISLYWLLRKAFLPLLAILWNSAFKWVCLPFSALLSLLFYSQLFVRPPQRTILSLLSLSFLSLSEWSHSVVSDSLWPHGL